MSQCHHFIKNATQGPDVTLLVVGLLLADLGRQIVRSSDGRLGTIICMLEDSRDTEISYLDLISLCHEDVLGLQITMQNLSIVDVFYCQAHLDEPVEDLVFGVCDLANFLLISNFSIKIAPIGIVHHNAQTFFIHKRFFVRDNIWMSHGFQDVNLFPGNYSCLISYLIDSVFSLLFVHLGYIDDLYLKNVQVSTNIDKKNIK